MRRYGVLLFLFFFGWTQSSYGYDIDSHFYMTAAGLIKRGVKKEVALKIAAYAQWIDESLLTTPMQSERKRRIFHFPMPLMIKEVPRPSAAEVAQVLTLVNGVDSELVFDQLNGFDGLVSYSDRVHGKDLGVLAEVKENNPMAYDILKKGLANGDYILVGAGLHILMDSFGHYGFSSALGHASAGHDPDAPYKHQERYYRMLKTFFDVTTVLLHAMPDEAKNRSAIFRRPDGTSIPLVAASSEEIFESFIQQADVKKAIEEDIQRSEEYTKVAVSTILTSLYQSGALKNLDKVIHLTITPELFRESKTTEEIMSVVIQKMIEQGPEELEALIDLPILQDRYLRPISMHLTIPQFVATHKGVEGAAAKLSNLITYKFIAHNISASEQFVVDPEGLPREVEMKMRIKNWQAVIEGLIGEKVIFDKGKNIKDYILEVFKERFLRRHKNPSERDFSPVENGELGLLEKGIEGIKVGVNYKEQMQWNWRMFNIVYIDFLRYVQFHSKWKWADFIAAQGMNKWHYLTSMIGWNLLESLPGSHDVIDPQVYFIQNEEEFKKALSDGVFKKVITPEQVAHLKKQYNRNKKDFRTEVIYVCRDTLRKG